MFDESDGILTPARTIYKRGHQKKVNRQSSSKAAGIVDTESVLESLILIAAELDPRVVRIHPQPCTFDLNTGEIYPSKKALSQTLDGSGYAAKVYTPDFLLELTSGQKVFVEGKHTHWIRKNPEFGSLLDAMAALGHRLSVVTEAVFSRPLERNLRILKTSPTFELTQYQREWLLKDCPRSLSFRSAEKFGLGKTAVYTAIKEGYLSTPLDCAPFNDRTMLSPSAGDVSHMEVLAL
ncbi:Tn7 transposase TnsA N-terminal domain-containing protein [Mameliella alba]|nr:Tn7 transposase TnsA N-terminal domain-containing protein [Mameliella alba]MBY6167901.1 Tn7 transposase TnsA N-terminal domain-containing protein [Mameliella alba]MBY6172922.1 Tn7 transposase TnsA N-terminal domain-containing protein [Mameliella alba]